MLLDPHDWALASRIDDVLPVLSRHVADHAAAETHGSALELASGPHPTALAAAARAGRAARGPGRRPRPARAARGRRGHAPVRAVERRRGLPGRPLPVDLRLDARAGAARADVRAPRPRRGARPRVGDPGAARPARARAAAARPRGELAVLAGPRHGARRRARADLRHVPARRHPAGVRRLRRVRRGDRRAAALRGVPRADASCGGTCGCSRGSGRSRSASWTRRRARPTTPRSPRSPSASCGSRRPRATPTRRSRAGRRCSTRTASSPRATACGPRSSIPSPTARKPAREILDELLAACAPHAAELGCEAELAARAGARRRARRPPPAHARRRATRAIRSGPASAMLVAALANDFGTGLAAAAPRSPSARLRDRAARLDLVRVLRVAPVEVGEPHAQAVVLVLPDVAELVRR